MGINYNSKILSDKEKFLFGISGKLPCPICGKGTIGKSFRHSTTLLHTCCVMFNSFITDENKLLVFWSKNGK